MFVNKTTTTLLLCCVSSISGTTNTIVYFWNITSGPGSRSRPALTHQTKKWFISQSLKRCIYYSVADKCLAWFAVQLHLACTCTHKIDVECFYMCEVRSHILCDSGTLLNRKRVFPHPSLTRTRQIKIAPTQTHELHAHITWGGRDERAADWTCVCN